MLMSCWQFSERGTKLPLQINMHKVSLSFSLRLIAIFKCQIQRTVPSPSAFYSHFVLASVGGSSADTDSAHCCKVSPCIITGEVWAHWRKRDCRTTENQHDISLCERGAMSRRVFIDLRSTLNTSPPSSEELISLSLICHTQ